MMTYADDVLVTARGRKELKKKAEKGANEGKNKFIELKTDDRDNKKANFIIQALPEGKAKFEKD